MRNVILASLAFLSFGCAATSDTAVAPESPQTDQSSSKPYNSQQVIKNEVNILPAVQQSADSANKTASASKTEKKDTVDVNSIAVNDTIANTPVLHKSSLVTLQVEGYGVAPANAMSIPQAKVMARRAAIADAYRALAEKMYGIRVKGRETVKDLMLKNSEVSTDVYGLIRGACIQEEKFKDGIYTVVMSVKLDVRKWNKYINAN